MTTPRENPRRHRDKERVGARASKATSGDFTMKRGPQLVASAAISLVAWASLYTFAPLSPAWLQVVEAVRAAAARARAHPRTLHTQRVNLKLTCVLHRLGVTRSFRTPR